MNCRQWLLMAGMMLMATAIQAATQFKVATFNVSMEARNYTDGKNEPYSAEVLARRLESGSHPQIRNIAEIIQRVRPDIILLNEFDYIADPARGVQAFINKYLKKPQGGQQAIDYPYFYYAPVNTGEPIGVDMNGDGQVDGRDTQGFGFFPGHYGMVLLSRYPIIREQIRTFRYFLWRDMPGNLQPQDPATGKPWYSDAVWQRLRLSSKSHWDIPVSVAGKVVHILASHPTPPVFDGKEDRNGRRNHDEIRFWQDYLTPAKATYIYDDKGNRGGLAETAAFVIVGDLNASAVEGQALCQGIAGLLRHPRVQGDFVPVSEGGRAHQPDNPHAASHTAHWGMRADYVLPSRQLQIKDGGVFWPLPEQPSYKLIASRSASSDHRLVWLSLAFVSGASDREPVK